LPDGHRFGTGVFGSKKIAAMKFPAEPGAAGERDFERRQLFHFG
jgi:hypothetical protein